MLGKLKKRKRLRTHWFLARTATFNWAKVLKNRRRKGRHELTVSYPVRYKATRGKSKMHIIAWGTARVVTYPGSTIRLRKI